MDLLILFLSAFGAATLLPFYSEALLVFLLNKPHNVFALWFFATLGNALGAAVNWTLGMQASHFEDRKWFPFKPETLHRAQHWFRRYGVWSLLFSWLPVGGDALTCIAGAMRVNFWIFLALTTIGKGARYAVVIGLYYGWAPFLSKLYMDP
jgi:membrane protein YqaA with SNARE-associated domain